MRHCAAGFSIAIALAGAAAHAPGQSPDAEQPAAAPPAGEAREPRAYDIALEHNARVMAMAEEDKAWPVYARVYRQIEDTAQWDLIRDYEVGAPIPEKLAAWLNENRELIDEIAEATKRPHLGAPIYWEVDPLIDPGSDAKLFLPGDEPPPLIQALYNWMPPTRRCAMLLDAAAGIALQREKIDTAIDHIDAIQRMSGQIEGLWMLDDLVRLSIQDRAVRASRSIAMTSDDQPTLAGLSSIMARAGDFGLATAGERHLALDLVERVYTDGGRAELSIRGAMLLVDLEILQSNPAVTLILEMIDWGDPESIEAAQAGFSGTNEYLNRATGSEERDLMDRYFEALREMQQLPPWVDGDASRRVSKAESEAVRFEDEIEERKGYPVAPSMLPSTRSVNRSERWTSRSVARAVIALKRHYLRHNRWPDTLGDIDEDLTLGPMLDGYTGEPIHYQPTEQGALLTWSPHSRGVNERRMLIVPEPGREP